MSGLSPSDRVFDLLLKEYEVVSQEIRGRIITNDSLIASALLILGAGLIYGIGQGKEAVIVAIPLGFFGLLLYALFNATAIQVLAGYRRYLEERINRHVGQEVLQWERVGAPLRRRSFSTIALFMFALLLFLGTSLMSLGLLLRRGLPLFLGALLGFLCMCGLLVVGGKHLASASTAAYSLAKKGLPQATSSAD